VCHNISGTITIDKNQAQVLKTICEVFKKKKSLCTSEDKNGEYYG